VRTRLAGGVFKRAEPVFAEEAVLAAIPNNCRKVLPHCNVLGAFAKKNHASYGLWMIAPEKLSGIGESERSPHVLGEQADRPECAQQPIGHFGVQSKLTRDGARRHRLAAQDLEDIQCRASVDRLTAPSSGDEIEEQVLRICHQSILRASALM
jgi:hypothetical protein